MARRYIFSSESVAEGHPDKVCDTISDQILDACLTQDPKSRVACETLAKGNLVVIAGEITTNARFDYLEEVRSAIREIGYVHDDSLFHADTCVIAPFRGFPGSQRPTVLRLGGYPSSGRESGPITFGENSTLTAWKYDRYISLS